MQITLIWEPITNNINAMYFLPGELWTPAIRMFIRTNKFITGALYWKSLQWILYESKFAAAFYHNGREKIQIQLKWYSELRYMNQQTFLG